MVFVSIYGIWFADERRFDYLDVAVQKKEKIELLALSFILSGALGNVIDRIQFGYVIDFIQVYYGEHYFPVFNIADSAICVGAVLLFFANHKKTPRKKVK